jgi:mersacidin/lichenicidin family type 2 lantibiotic
VDETDDRDAFPGNPAGWAKTNMNTLNENELTEVAGGLSPVEVTLFIAIATYVTANWSQIKKGVADGFSDGFSAVAQ